MHDRRPLVLCLIAALVPLTACGGDEEIAAEDAQAQASAQAPVAPVAPGGAPAELAQEPRRTFDVPEDMAALVPANVFAYVQIESADAIERIARDAQAAFGRTDAVPVRALAQLASVAGLAVDDAALDAARPIGIAFTLLPGELVPLPTLVLPLAEGAPDALEVAQGFRELRSGGYVGLSKVPDYALAERAPAFLAGLTAGQFSARVDLAEVIAAYRLMIDSGLTHAEALAAQQVQAEPSSLDIEAALEFYFECLRAFLDSAERWDIGLQVAGTAWDVDGEFTAREGSAMADFPSGESTSLIALAGALDPEASMIMLVGASWKDVFARYEDSIAGLWELYPESFQGLLEEQMSAWKQMLPLIGDATVASGGFGPDGMRFSYVVESEQPQTFVDEYRSAVLEMDFSASGIELGDISTRELAGVECLEYRMVFGDEFLTLMSAGQTDAGALEEARRMSDALYGKDGMFVRFFADAGHVVMTLGGDEAYVAETRAKLRASASASAADLPAGIARALARVGRDNPVWVGHMDLARIFAELWETIRNRPDAMRPASLAAFDDVAVPVTFYGSIAGRSWRWGGFADVAPLGELLEAIEATDFEALEAGEPETGEPGAQGDPQDER